MPARINVPGHFAGRIYVDMLEEGDIVNQRIRGRGIVLRVGPRTLKVKFSCSTATWSQFRKNTPLINLDGMTVEDHETIINRI